MGWALNLNTNAKSKTYPIFQGLLQNPQAWQCFCWRLRQHLHCVRSYRGLPIHPRGKPTRFSWQNNFNNMNTDNLKHETPTDAQRSSVTIVSITLTFQFSINFPPIVATLC
jgi:hypothetical protein